MATKSTKQQDRDRRAKVEAMRKAEQARQRRRSAMFIVISVVVGLGLIAAAAVPAYLERRNDPKNRPLSDFGVRAAAADCGDVTNDPATGVNAHVGPGTNEPEKTKVDYGTVPPSSGEHFPRPAFPAREFYNSADRPPMEQLVHNLEHGYTILWYDGGVLGAQREALEDIAASARGKDPTRGKFIVSRWDEAYGEFPAGKHVALSHWGAEQGHRQLCGKVSGAVVNDFIERFPASDSPEPNAA
ncbi:MAG: DUF3105 domain-containing protein [Actinomycetes bacterium]